MQLFGDYTTDHGRRATAALFSDGAAPTAVFSGSDAITLGVLEELRLRNLAVGADVSLIPLDDVSPLQFFDPPLTAIRQSVAQMGDRGVELIAEAAGKATSIAVERLPVEFIRRASVGPPRHSSVNSGTRARIALRGVLVEQKENCLVGESWVSAAVLVQRSEGVACFAAA